MHLISKMNQVICCYNILTQDDFEMPMLNIIHLPLSSKIIFILQQPHSIVGARNSQ